MFEDEDAWASARMAIVGRSKPDLKPMADMLRGGNPIPPGVRDMLAELFDPDTPDYLGLRCVVVPTQTQQKQATSYKHWEIAKAHADERAKGSTFDEAARVVGEGYGKDERTVKLYVASWKRLMSRVRGHGGNEG